MQTLQNHKIGGNGIARRSENCKEKLTAKPRNGGNRVNRGHRSRQALMGPLPFHADPAVECFSAVDCESPGGCRRIMCIPNRRNPCLETCSSDSFWTGCNHSAKSASSFRLEVAVFSVAISYTTCSSWHGEEGTVHLDSPSQVPKISAAPSAGLDCAGAKAQVKRKMPARMPALQKRRAKRTTDFRGMRTELMAWRQIPWGADCRGAPRPIGWRRPTSACHRGPTGCC